MSKVTTKERPRITPEAYAELQKPWGKATVRNAIGVIFAQLAYDGPIGMLVSMFLTFVYTEYLGVSPAMMGVVVSSSVIVDGVTDFLMGMVTDRVRTKYGKMRHWFRWVSLPLFVFAGIMFMPPATASGAVKLVYVFIVYNVFCTLETMVRIPGAAAFTLCTDNEKARGNIIWLVSIVFSFVGMAIQWIINPMVTTFGGGLAGYRVTAWIFGLVAAISLIVAFYCCRETKLSGDWDDVDAAYKKEHNTEKRESIMQQFGYLLGNKWWVVLMLSKIAGGLVMGFNMAVQAYFLQYVLGDMAWLGAFGTTRIFMMIGAAASVILINKMDARTLSICLYALKAVGLGIAFAFSHNVWIVLVGMSISSLSDGLIQPANGIIIARVIDYGEWKNGVRQEGLCNSGQSVMGRIGTAVATAVCGFVMAAFGYSGAGTVTPACANAIGFMFLGIPFICAILNLVIFWFMKLDGKTVDGYRAELKARHEAQQI